MKFDYNENNYGLDLVITPETPKEVAELLRATRNAKAEKPTIYFSFSGDVPNMTIGISKRKLEVQHNSISPETK